MNNPRALLALRQAAAHRGFEARAESVSKSRERKLPVAPPNSWPASTGSLRCRLMLWPCAPASPEAVPEKPKGTACLAASSGTLAAQHR